MKKLLSALAVLAALSLPAHAEPVKAGAMEIESAFARASPKVARAGAGFMTLRNTGTEADRLIAASSEVSAVTELHTHINDNGVMRMRQVEAIDIPAGGTVELKPGGLHVMFMNLHGPLMEGTEFPVILRFERAGEVTVTIPVKGVAAMGAMPGHRMGH